MEAVAQGSTVVGCKSSTAAVLVALKRSSSDLATRHEKLFCVSKQVGVAVSGLVSDGYQIATILRDAAINSSFVYKQEARVSQLCAATTRKLQSCTQHSSRRPYGVGIILAGFDESGVQLHQIMPTGETYECEAISIGSRSQASKTYLEKRLKDLPSMTLDELVLLSLSALREACPDGKLDAEGCTLGAVHAGEFRLLGDSDVHRYLSLINHRNG